MDEAEGPGNAKSSRLMRHRTLPPPRPVGGAAAFVRCLEMSVDLWSDAHWGRVTPFALTSGSELRPSSGPARFGSPEFIDQARDVLELSANLTDPQKTAADYWADGPRSETPPGHWNLFAQFVSRRDRLGLNDDVKLSFAMNNALLDGFISCWDTKASSPPPRPGSTDRATALQCRRCRDPAVVHGQRPLRVLRHPPGG